MDERELPTARPAVPVDPQSRPDATHRPAKPADVAAFSAFYREFVPELVVWLRWQGARLPVAADIAQETMIEAYERWLTIEWPKAWARRVASRALARHIANIRDEPVDDIGEHSALLPSSTNVAEWEQRHEVLRCSTFFRCGSGRSWHGPWTGTPRHRSPTSCRSPLRRHEAA